MQNAPTSPSTLAPMASTRELRAPSVRSQDTAPRVVQASALLGERQSVEIEYKGQHYRLQTTKAGKLILTK